MKIAEGVEMLELPMNMGGMESIIYLTLIWDDTTVILVDAGLPGQLQEIREKMSNAGVPFDKLNMVIVTHQDIDHIGGIPDILNDSDHKVKILAHDDDKPYIQGEKRLNKITPERMVQISAQLNALPEKQREAMKALFENPPKANVDKTLTDREELPHYGGITVIHTPGHTPGHICLYLKQNKTLIAGDTMNIVDGELIGPNPQNTPDMDSAIKSLKKFTQYDIKNVICYHGGLYSKDANQRIAELTKE